MHLKPCMHEHFDLIINPFKYKCEICQVFIYPFQKIVVNAKCNSWIMDLTTFKMNDSIHVQMLIIQDTQKNSLTHSSINVRHEVIMCVSIYISKCNMQRLNSGFNKFKMDDWTHVKILIFQEMWKRITKPFRYNYKMSSCMCFNIL
jgi:hypothetical protein